ncbi:hypothetical protein M0R45_021079 [Rubus argutus]|uniref:Protein FAR1-RELATED SEQUENCE n=1 Tax=Rubus argutus TaxID=59490 RepID=A0AAW1XC60_RUBAR
MSEGTNSCLKTLLMSFNCGFAKQCGFSIRRHRTRGKDGVGRGVTRRDFTCHRGGYPQMKPAEDGKMQRNRKSSRCGCQAYMRIVKRADFDVPEWRITGFSNVHNHDLLKSNHVSLLPAYCSISPDDKSRICMYAKAGMSVRQMLRLMELEKGVKLGCLAFSEIDVRNLLQSFRNVNRDNDAIDLIAMCKKMKDEDPNFKYEFKIDGHNRLEHIAWSYGSSIQLYEEFGDAVVFDTTYRLDAYDMLLGIWLGVDNHGMTCFFGCVLLRDENMQSFSWALKFSEWFSVLLGSRYDDWKAEFHQLYNLHSVEDLKKDGWNVSQLDRFVEQVPDIVNYSDRAGAKQSCNRSCLALKTGSPIESHAASVLTPYAFGKLQDELVLAPQYASLLVDEGCFQVRHHTQACLSVSVNNNCFRIPDQYLPARWCRVSSSSTNTFQTATMKDKSEKIQILESMASTLVAESIETGERLDAACQQISVESLKRRRPKETVESNRKRRHCAGPCCLSVQ